MKKYILIQIFLFLKLNFTLLNFQFIINLNL